MCRLLAYAAPRDTTVTKVIGDMNSDAFQRMTSVHNDGWGTAWLAAGFSETEREIESLRISTPGQNDPLLSTLLADAPSNARIVHLRLATDDFKRTKVNTHPFVADGLAFAHNGSIVPTWRFDDLLRPDIRATVAGDTDSELYFGLVRQNVRDELSLEDAAAAAVRVLRAEFPSRASARPSSPQTSSWLSTPPARRTSPRRRSRAMASTPPRCQTGTPTSTTD